MAEGFARTLAPEGVGIYSAGVEKHGLNPYAVRVMAELGIDIGGRVSNLIEEIPLEEVDFIITLCDKAAVRCPAFSGTVGREHWGFEDPADASGGDDEIMAVYRRVRDGLEKKVGEFFAIEYG